MEFAKRPFFLIILVILAIGLAQGWDYFVNRSNKPVEEAPAQAEPETTVVNLSNLDPTDFDDVVKREFATANAKAAEVSPDLKIASIEVNIDQELSVDSISTRYIYSFPGDNTNNWMITIASQTGSYIRALIPKVDYVGNVAPFDISSWKFNYVTALQLAEKAGGQSWRENDELTGVSLTLKSNDDKSALVWTVEYQSMGKSQKISLNATTGKTISQ